MIKTVYCRAENRDEFDDKVNDSIKNGYHLTEIKVIPAPQSNFKTMLFALLEKGDENT